MSVYLRGALMNHGRFLILATLSALVAFLALPASPALGATYEVDTTDDDAGIAKSACTGSADDCSLRGAITNANTASSPGDLITFDATVFNPGTIAIASALPNLSDGGDTIDGTGATGVVIDSTDEARGFICLPIVSAGNTVKGLQLTDCSMGVALDASGDNNTIGPGNTMFDNTAGVVAFSGTDGNTIIGNKIGTNAAGTAIPAEGGNTTGINMVGGTNNTVGGTSPADRNVISGNSTGISFASVTATGNTVIGNFIGTDAAGTGDLGNSVGLSASNSAANNTIGGTAPGQGNLISGNSLINVNLSSSAASNEISGNIIGPDVNGSGALVSGDGVRIQNGASNNTIGPRNVISGNSSHGVRIQGSGTTGNVVRGNFIGTDLTGTAGTPNAVDGVQIQSSADDNIIGGTGSGDGNIIAFNGGDGVEINGAVAPAATGNSIRSNSIHSNVQDGIENSFGGNTELLPPILASTLFGTVSGFACANCEVDVFSDPSTDARFYEGTVTAAGDGSFTFQNEAPFIGSSVTATNTDASGNTSELATFLIIDSDGDGATDETDTDDDNDGLLDVSDPCRVFPEDFDGFEDADGCPDPDNDQDGICDPGQSSDSCTGSDEGEMVFDSAGTLPAPTIDCRNIPEDFDAFKDDDGCPEPDNDNDGFPDTTDACPGTDAHAGGDGMLGSPEDLDHNGIQNGAEDPLTTDDVVLTFEDYDGVLDGDGCHDSPGDDFDGDSFGVLSGGLPIFHDEREVFLGTNPGNGCAATPTANDEPQPDAWPVDADDNQFVNLLDVLPMKQHFNTTDPDPDYNPRFDLQDQNGTINLFDVLPYKAFFLTSCAP
jgi:hypothetical protein